MINIKYSMECSDCMEPFLDEGTGDILTASSERGVKMAAYSRGWFVPYGDDDFDLCPNCRVEAGV